MVAAGASALDGVWLRCGQHSGCAVLGTGIDHSPLGEQYSASSRNSLSACALFDAVCSSQMVAKTGVFFLMEQLRPGSTMTLFFPSEVDSPAILPHDVAENAPFANLDNVLATFNIPAGSAAAARVRDTLSRCHAPPLAGEVKACATSLEATVQAALRMLGGTDDHRVLAAASEIPLAGLPRQPYVIEKVSQVDGEQYVSCHRVPFPYAVYQCHTALRSYGAYQVSLRGLGGGASPAVEMLAFCHLDTSGWNPAHPAFEVLQTRPGDTPVCHFVTYGNLAFVKKKVSWALA
ncbi:hypothetical protein PR202_gb24181 [Eleusine coracana subsp. coracana]|uniref:BURP domain-containing protein n=1 Tax=Eleusine coracana subsp. coracana TaxID=191504 RepID=A0AAV5FKV5_ELECO|nr:hypothetical protein PR202_gb24181 [Eleusine coracana subsp. coracana]